MTAAPTDGSPSLVIRRGVAADNVLLAEMGAETFADAFGRFNSARDMELYLAASFGPEIQAAELADPRSVFLIAEIGGRAVGYARLREGDPPCPCEGARPIEIVRFYARTPWIGRKVGAALMETCLREAGARACDAIWLDVWEQNERAIAFYERWGFATVGAQEFRLGNDVQNDLLMARAVKQLP